MSANKKINFNDLSPEKLIEGINITIKNAESIFETAISSKNLGNYGLAKSLFILSCEEAIKAFSIYNLFLIDDNRDISNIFNFHKPKLEILKKAYHLMSTEVLAMDKSFNQALKKNSNSLPLEKLALKFYNKNLNEIYLSLTKDQLENDEIWWDNANESKLKGFYVDFQNNDWITPQNTDQAEVKEAHLKALMIINHIQSYENADLLKYKSVK